MGMSRMRKSVLMWVMCFVMLFSQTGSLYVRADEGNRGYQTDASENETDEIGVEEQVDASADEAVEAEEVWDGGDLKSGEWVRITYDGQEIDTITVNGKTVGAKYVTLATRGKINVGTDTTYSCAAFVKRFYSTVYGVDVYNLSGPSYTPLSSSGGYFSQVSTPQVGDIVRDNEETHWAIVKSVQADGKAVLIQQNRHWEKGDGYTYGDKNGNVGTRNVTYFRYSGNNSGGSTTDSFPSSFPLVDGKRYVIQSALSNKAIEVSCGVTDNRKQLNLWTFTYPGDKWQTWIAVKQSNGYVFKNAHTGMAMDIKYASQDEGKEVVQCYVDGAASQTFKVYPVGDGKYGLINANSNKAVDVAGSDTKDGATLNQYTWHGKSNQLWYFEPADREFTLYLEPNGGAFSDGNTSTVSPDRKLLWGSGDWWWDVSRYNVTRDGYTFDGWYTDPNGGTKIYGTDGIRVNDGTYWRDNIYVYDGDCRVYAHWIQNAPADTENPVINDVQITDLSPEGYTIVCDATDNAGIAKVCFPVWTANNDQDDLPGDWQSTKTASEIKDGKYYYYVKISDHNNERGSYINHIYVYDTSNNYSMREVNVTVPNYTTNITLSGGDGELTAGGDLQLSATIQPEDALKNISWTSSDTSIATVENGLVKGVGEGTVTITAAATDGSGVSSSWTLHVKGTAPSQETTNPDDGSGENSGNKDTGNEGGTDSGNDKSGESGSDSGSPVILSNAIAVKGKLDAGELIRNKAGFYGKIKRYTSSNKKIAKVNGKGIVTGKGNGTAQITAYTKQGREYVQIGTVTVNVVKPAFNFTKKDLTYTGASIDPYACTGNLASGMNVEWTASCKSGVAYMSGRNLVAGSKSGKVTLKCNIGTGKYAAKYKVSLRVKIPKIKSSVAIKEGNETKVTLSNVSSGTSVKWTPADSSIIRISSTSKPNVVKVSGLKDGTTTLTAEVDGVKYTTTITIGAGSRKQSDQGKDDKDSSDDKDQGGQDTTGGKVDLRNLKEFRESGSGWWYDTYEDNLGNTHNNVYRGNEEDGWIEYQLDKSYTKLTATGAIPSGYSSYGKIKIYGDDILLYETKDVIDDTWKNWNIDVDVEGIELLRIYVSWNVLMCDPVLEKGVSFRDRSTDIKERDLNLFEPWREGEVESSHGCWYDDYCKEDIAGHIHWNNVYSLFGDYFKEYDLTTDKFKINGKSFNTFKATITVMDAESKGTIKFFGDNVSLGEYNLEGVSKYHEDVEIKLNGVTDFRIEIAGDGVMMSNPKMLLKP